MVNFIPLYLFALLLPWPFILAQDAPKSTTTESASASNDVGIPSVSGASGLFDHFPFKAPNFGFNKIPSLPALFGSRRKRSPQYDVEEHLRDDSAFFRRVVRCNFLTQGGFRCTGCNTVRRCYPFNIGTVTTCSGLFPYCRNGVCSTTKGALCSSTTSTTESSTSTTSSTSSSSSSTSSSTSTTSSSSTSTSTSSTTQNTNG